jgi:hypothetical protein
MRPVSSTACTPNGWLEPVESMRVPTLALAIITPSEEVTAPALPEAPAALRGPVRAPEPEPAFSFVQTIAATDPAACAVPVRYSAALQPLPAISIPRAVLQQMWMPVPAAEAVWASVEPSAALDTASTGRGRVIQFPAPLATVEPMPVVDHNEPVSASCDHSQEAPQPEPVWSLVQYRTMLEPTVHAAAIALPQFTNGTKRYLLPEAPAAPSLRAEPASRFVQPAAVSQPTIAATAIQLPRFDSQIEPLPLQESTAAPSLQAEPVFRLIQPGTALELAPAPSAEQLPKLTAEVEPMPTADEEIETPTPCVTWKRAPEPEPVFAFIRSSSAPARSPAPPIREPGMGQVSVAGPHIPNSLAFHAAPGAEPVMAGVWPHVADIPFEPILGAAAIQLPRISALRIPAVEPRVTTAVDEPAAEAAETLVTASRSTTPVSASANGALPQQQMAPAALGGTLELAARVNSPAPEALETLLTASSADQIKSAAVVRLQPFAVAASEGRGLNSFDTPRFATPATPPSVAATSLAVMPISTVKVTAPVPQQERPMPGIPKPGLVALEFHANQARGKSNCKLEWRSVRFTPLPPRFTIRPVWEKTEIAPPKPAPPKTSVAEVFTMPEVKQRNSKTLAYAIKIAAGLVIVAATWYGASSIRMDRSLQVRASGSNSSSPVLPSAGGNAAPAPSTVAAAKTQSKGAIASVRESIARRAAVQVSDNLREGMEAWGSSAKAYAAGWSRNAEGYVNPGALALLSPTKTFTDYRMEFFGQIEKKSIGWTVRSKDQNNYHAMKFTVVEAGLRPVIAMVHYNVINGKASRKLQTPLTVMVHNNRPIQVAVDVKGNRFVTSVDGEEVDSYSDDTLASGGVGFFSEAGEKARLYWVKVSKNDDWLGHVCAFLSGVDAAPAGAELWAPELPGSPAPFHPDGGHASLAGAWIAAPFAHASRRARMAKSRRYQEWNT